MPVVGLGGREPPASSLSAKCREPLWGNRRDVGGDPPHEWAEEELAQRGVEDWSGSFAAGLERDWMP
jgi:hypothetical protein